MRIQINIILNRIREELETILKIRPILLYFKLGQDKKFYLLYITHILQSIITNDEECQRKQPKILSCQGWGREKGSHLLK